MEFIKKVYFISSLGELLNVIDNLGIIFKTQSNLKIPILSTIVDTNDFHGYEYNNHLDYVKCNYKDFTNEHLQEWHQQQLLLMKLAKLIG